MANKFVIEVKARGFTNLESQLNRSDGAMKNFGKNSERAGRQTNALRKQISLVRNNLLLYTFAVGAAARTMNTFLRSASNMQESMSKFKVVFGNASDDALGFAKTLSTSFNRSESSIIELMSSLQDTFVPLGFSRDEARKLSQALTQLSFDIGSFNNVASPEVAHALTSAIVGNHEAVRRFGIVLTEAQLKQEAFRTGVTVSNRELTAQEKVMARVSLIINSTKDAQGDLARTQHEFANRVRALQDQYKDLSIQIGRALIPTAEFLMKHANVAHLKGYASAVVAVGTGYAIYRRQAIAATMATQGFRLALIKSGAGIAVLVLGELAANTVFAKEATEDNTTALTDYKDVMDELLSTMTAPSSPSEIVKHILGLKGVQVKSDKEIAEENKKNQDERREGVLKAVKEIERIEKELTAFYENEQLQRRESFLAAEQEMAEVREQMNNAEIFATEEKRRTFLAAAEEIKELEAEMARDNAKAAQDQLENTMRVAAGFRGFSDMLGQAILDGQDFGDAVVNSLEAIAAKVAAEFASFAILSLLTGGTATASQLGFKTLGAFIGHSGGKISNRGIQAFNTGGQVQGRDNVPILAQAGEYIIKKDSAQAIGLDKLNEINDTGQTGSLTVNVSAPLVDETVIDSIIPAIQKASRFNLA